MQNQGKIPLMANSWRALLHHHLDSTPCLGTSPSPHRAPPGRAPTCVVSPELVRAIFGSRGSLSQVIVVVRAIPAAQREEGKSQASPFLARIAPFPLTPCCDTPRSTWCSRSARWQPAAGCNPTACPRPGTGAARRT